VGKQLPLETALLCWFVGSSTGCGAASVIRHHQPQWLHQFLTGCPDWPAGWTNLLVTVNGNRANNSNMQDGGEKGGFPAVLVELSDSTGCCCCHSCCCHSPGGLWSAS